MFGGWEMSPQSCSLVSWCILSGAWLWCETVPELPWLWDSNNELGTEKKNTQSQPKPRTEALNRRWRPPPLAEGAFQTRANAGLKYRDLLFGDKNHQLPDTRHVQGRFIGSPRARIALCLQMHPAGHHPAPSNEGTQQSSLLTPVPPPRDTGPPPLQSNALSAPTPPIPETLVPCWWRWDAPPARGQTGHRGASEMP